MSIKVTGGYLRGRVLKTLPGRDTRPTIARVREAVFSILQHDLEGAEFLDLFAGSGVMAIEAVSRGAVRAVLVEKHPKAAAVIRHNLNLCGLELPLVVADYVRAMEQLASEGRRFDLIYADPPYGLVDPVELFRLAEKYSLLKPDGLFIMEHAGDLTPETEKIIKTRRFGDSAITIFAHG